MNENNLKLQTTFYFSNADLNANRGGVLSVRQQARQRAAGSSIRLAIVAFVLVMLGTLGFILFFTFQSQPENLNLAESILPILIAGGVILTVILIGIFSSRRHIQTSQANRIAMARGAAVPGKARPDSANFPIKIGETTIRLTTAEQLDAFEPGVQYRVFYLPGPVPVVLSGEVIGTEAESDIEDTSANDEPLERDIILERHQAGRQILVVLAGLVFLIPLAAYAAANLSSGLRWLVLLGLLGVGIGFVFWALGRFKR